MKKISQSRKEEALLQNDKIKVIGLIIAAGFSSRMGKFKPLIDWNEKPFLTNIIDKLKLVCDKIVIVTGYNSEAIEKYYSDLKQPNKNKIKLIKNSDYEKGMFTSLKAGLNKITENSWVLYHLVDQPNLPNEFYQEFVAQVDETHNWIQPTFKRRKGHPILFNKKVISLILKSEDNSNLRIVSLSNKTIKKYWKCDYKEVHSDFDTPKDLEKFNQI